MYLNWFALEAFLLKRLFASSLCSAELVIIQGKKMEKRILFCTDAVHLIFPQRTPWFNGWGFNLPRGQSLLDKWNLIPEGIDILMTHGPPLGK